MSQSEERIPRRASKKDQAKRYFEELQKALAKGDTVEYVLEHRIPPDKYDLIVDYFGEELDALTLSAEQKDAIASVKRDAAGRPTFPNGYKKPYSDKFRVQAYDAIIAALQEIDAEIVPRDKVNYRDIHFILNGSDYDITLSKRRKNKESPKE